MANAYTPLVKEAPKFEGKTYPGMVVVGQFVKWEQQSLLRE